MSKLPELTLTKAGAAMLAKTPIGSEIPVTKWRIGDGQLPGGEDPRDRTQLVNPVRELPIASVENNGNQCLIKGQLVNTVMDEFTWRETGLYATDPDDGEILYAYGYEADGAEIPAGATQLREIEFGVELVFDTAANVTAVISKTLIFATLEDLENWQSKVVDEAMSRIIRGDITTALHADTGEQLTTDDGIQIDAVRIL
ncbi:phage tail-collar fiber domain-containing protein [Candidatus Avoscillospira sp. LCP25S3_F1]|uniref:phage tail-collar fiber domain-containing protein n=1 Tax=Candidatus Avoscillospira sp. LCP25S3_F1 TaxID=3438825 RepID=UPI003F8F9B9C